MSVKQPRTAQFGAIGFAAIALGCAGMAAFMVSRMMDDRGLGGEKMVPVVVAKMNLSAADTVTIDELEVVAWPEKMVPEGAAATLEAIFAANKDPVPTTGILKGEVIVPSRLASSKQGTGIAALLRPGFRAVAVKVDDSVGRSGLVYPGAHVDVLATIRDTDGQGPSTRIAVGNVRVLSLEAQTDVATRRTNDQQDKNAPQRNDTVVTLEVSPADAEIVALAVREGRVDLALRNGNDTAEVETTGAVPLMFSAFAPTELPADEAPAPAARSERGARKSPASVASSSADARARRRINVNANDATGRDVPTNNTNGIQTYVAR